MEMRASLQDKDESKTLKAKMRERTRPKLGKIDIDYQKLHDAFFKYVIQVTFKEKIILFCTVGFFQSFFFTRTFTLTIFFLRENLDFLIQNTD